MDHTITLTEHERASLETLVRFHGSFDLYPAHRTILAKLTVRPAEDGTLF